ncbi:hypothetical protein R3P38DRAFT_3191819 [Favolaschia claudopus]|uniref:Uncharacterized protein n=1 Tax=Favolaschia claudopus TaxID=2862362 RepID=A0AAW0BK30_9AGAR
MSFEANPQTLPTTLFPTNTHPNSDPKLLVRLAIFEADIGAYTNLQHLAAHGLNVDIPQTTTAADELLHFVSTYRNVCKTEELSLRQKLHSTVVLLHILQDQIEVAMRKLTLADQDMGHVRAVLRMNGPPGIHISVPDCDVCCDCFSAMALS